MNLNPNFSRLFMEPRLKMRTIPDVHKTLSIATT